MTLLKGELQDDAGNILHPHTSGDSVFMANGKTIEEQMNGWKFYNSITELGLTETSTMQQIGNAMQVNSVLYHVKAQSTGTIGEFPTASGTLTATKTNDYRVYFKFETAISATGTGLEVYEGASTPVAWSGWKPLSTIYTDFSQLGLLDSQFSETDIVANMKLVSEAMPKNSKGLFAVSSNVATLYPNLSKSIAKKIAVDCGIGQTTSTLNLEINRFNTSSDVMSITINYESSTFRGVPYYFEFNIDSGVPLVTKAFKYATTEKTEIICTPNTGYSVLENSSYVINNCVYINIIVQVANATPNTRYVVATVPTTYKPLKITAISAYSSDLLYGAFAGISNTGNITIETGNKISINQFRISGVYAI